MIFHIMCFNKISNIFHHDEIFLQHFPNNNKKKRKKNLLFCSNFSLDIFWCMLNQNIRFCSITFKYDLCFTCIERHIHICMSVCAPGVHYLREKRWKSHPDCQKLVKYWSFLWFYSIWSCLWSEDMLQKLFYVGKYIYNFIK